MAILISASELDELMYDGVELNEDFDIEEYVENIEDFEDDFSDYEE